MEMDNGLKAISIVETVMYRVKQGLGALTLRNYDGQCAEALAKVCGLNKMTESGLPERERNA
ncbi:hypothetical protein K9692_004787 [Escherichia coli]|nr:hypothetical protein [Escherichia coli]